jgi:hypothetical protein
MTPAARLSPRKVLAPRGGSNAPMKPAGYQLDPDGLSPRKGKRWISEWTLSTRSEHWNLTIPPPGPPSCPSPVTTSHARRSDRSRRFAHDRRFPNKNRSDRRHIEASEENPIRHLAVHIRWIKKPKTVSHAPWTPFLVCSRRSAPIEALRRVHPSPRDHVPLDRTHLQPSCEV